MPPFKCEWSLAILDICTKVVPVSNGMSVSFLYDSAKDTIKWSGLSVRDNIGYVMRIGSLLYLSKEDFKKVLGSQNVERVLTVQDLKEMYGE